MAPASDRSGTARPARFARFMPLPSIAYRLARVAVGDGIATVTLRPVNAHDIVAGHALLTAAGGVLVAEDGMEVTYAEDGDPAAPLPALAARPPRWQPCALGPGAAAREPRREPMVTLGWPRVPEGQRLDRALGCMLGMVIGDSLGSQVEFQNAETIASDLSRRGPRSGCQPSVAYVGGAADR